MIQFYLQRPRSEDYQSLLFWLSTHNTSSTKAYDGERYLVEVKFVSVFNPVYFYQYLTMHHPHRSPNELRHPEEESTPKSKQFFSQAVALLPETWQSPDTITNQFEHEGHKEYFVRTIVAYFSSIHDVLYLWCIRVVTGDVSDLSAFSIDRLYPLSSHQRAILADNTGALTSRRDVQDNRTHHLTNNSDVICDAEVGEPISDHNINTFHVNVHPYHRKSSERKFYDYNKADWSRLNKLFEHIQWHCAFLSNDVNEVWSAWTDLFFTAVDECISKKKKKKNRRSPWISAEIIKLVRKKKRLYKKAKIRNNDESWSTYKKASNLLKKKCNKARWEYLDKLANDMHDKSVHKLSWNYVQSRRKGSNDLIVIKLHNGNVLTNEDDIAECMNEYLLPFLQPKTLIIFHHLIKLLKTRILVFYTVHLRLLARF